MTPYRNLRGKSGIVSYELSEDSITVMFERGQWRHYLYNAARPGRATVEQMKVLAKRGYGLNEYISSVVKDNFARRW